VLSEDPTFWLCSDQILVHSTNSHTKFLTLVIMENGIKVPKSLNQTRWLALPAEEREGIKAYIVNMVLNLGGNPSRNKDAETLLSKANSILVQIVKYEWNTTWKSFIPDICGASKTNLTLCQNNLGILKMLIEEIFEFGKNQMTAQQSAALK
jgi:exportin-1